MSQSSKVMIIGLDGATFQILDEMMDRDIMPNLARFRSSGVCGSLESTIPFGTYPAWPSFYTGQNPGKHGILQFYRKTSGYRLEPTACSYGPGAPFWDILGNAGRKMILVNMPATYPPKAINGIMITGVVTPTNYGYAHPSSIEDELKRANGGYRVNFSEIYPRGEFSLLEDTYDITKRRVAAFTRLLEKYPWDLSMVVFNEVDRMQHDFFRHLDRNHPRHEPDLSPALRDRFMEYFGYLDTCLRDLIRLSGDDCHVFVVSDHGACPLYRYLNVNSFLLSSDFLRLRNDPLTRMKAAVYRLNFSPKDIFLFLDRLGLGRLHGRVDPKIKLRLLRSLFLSLDDVDWSRTRAFSLGVSGNEIYLNQRSREPDGIVDPANERHQVLEELKTALREWRDPLTNQRVIDKVFLREEIYRGKYVGECPDLLFVPNVGYDGFNQHEFMSLAPVEDAMGISGTHDPYGIFLALGPEISGGRPIADLRIIDVMPTILHIMGLGIPREIDGVVRKDLYNTDSPAHQREIESASVLQPKAATEHRAYSEEEKRLIEQRLRDLGYL